MLTCLWRVIRPENPLIHEEGMVSLLSDTRTHLPAAPAHPPQHTGVLGVSYHSSPSSFISQNWGHSAELATGSFFMSSKCNSPVTALATDQMAATSLVLL